MSLFTFAEVKEACGGEFAGPVDLHQTIDSVVTDTRTPVHNGLFIALSGERFDAHDFLADAVKNGSVLLCVARDKAAKVPAGAPAILVKSPLLAYQALAAFHRRRFPNLKVIALTGSCGKTSTKEILRSILVHAYGAEHVLATEGNTNNQIGVPQNLLRLTPEHQYAVIEMGTNHFGEIEPLARMAQPQTSLLVSIGCCHLEAFKNLEGVAKEKSHIFCPDSVRCAVIPQECAGRGILEKAALSIPKILSFGFSDKATVKVVYGGGNLNGSSFELTDTATKETVHVNWNLTGTHQALNAGGAAAAALSLGIPLKTIGAAITEVNLPGFRMKRTEHAGALWINDAYNANPDSMCASLQWLAEFADPAHLLLVLGDMGELGRESLPGHLRVLNYALEHFPGARIAVIGLRMTEALAVLNLTSPKSPVAFPSAQAAVEAVREMARKDDLVFLKGSRSTGLEILEPGEN